MQVVDGEEQILRTGLAHHFDPAFTSIFQHIHFTARIHVDDVDRCISLLSHRGHAQRCFHGAPGRAGERVPFGGRLALCQRLGRERFDHITVLAMRHHQHAVVSGDLQGFEDAAIVKAQASVISGEDLEGLNPHLHQGGDLSGDLLIEAREVHVEGIIDGSFLGHLHPYVHGMLKALLFQYHKVHDRGGAAKGRGLVTGVMVIRGDGAKHGQVQVHMRVHAAGQDQLVGGIDHLGRISLKVQTDAEDLFVLNQNVSLERV